MESHPSADAAADAAPAPHQVSVVVPVYQGERTLPGLLDEIAALVVPGTTPGGQPFVVSEVLLVHDHGPDASAAVIRDLAARHPVVRPVWLSRNFGQHAATLAGMASAGGEWIVTLDEDGQHDPADIPVLLDAALSARADVVYAASTNPPSHGALRNAASRGSKALVARTLGRREAPLYQSYRLVLGETGRSVAAYAGAGVFLDVALGWVAARVTTAPVALRDEGDRSSGYSLRTLFSHFWRMVLSSGTRLLRMVSILGGLFALGGVALATVFVVQRLMGANTDVQGWTSTTVIVLLSTGAILFSLGVIAEYLGVAVNMAMGKPLYVIVSDPASGPLGRVVQRPGGRLTARPAQQVTGGRSSERAGTDGPAGPARTHPGAPVQGATRPARR